MICINSSFLHLRVGFISLRFSDNQIPLKSFKKSDKSLENSINCNSLGDISVEICLTLKNLIEQIFHFIFSKIP